MPDRVIRKLKGGKEEGTPRRYIKGVGPFLGGAKGRKREKSGSDSVLLEDQCPKKKKKQRGTDGRLTGLLTDSKKEKILSVQSGQRGENREIMLA